MEDIFVAGHNGKQKKHKCKVHEQLKKEAGDFLKNLTKKGYCIEEMATIIFLINRTFYKAELIASRDIEDML